MIVTVPFLACLAVVAQASGQAAKPAPGFSVKPVKVVEGLRPLAFAAGPKGSLFAATMEDKSIRIMSAATRETTRTLQGHPQPAMAVAWSQDGELIASGDESARIITWNAETGAKLHEMRTHTRGIQNLSFNYPRSILVSTGKDDVVKIWDPGTGREVHSVPGQGANFYSANFRGKTNDFGVGILGSGARLYNTAGKTMGFLVGHNGQGVFDIAFNTAGTRAVTAGRDGTAIVWDAVKQLRLGTLKGHSDWVVHCAFSPNGKWIATSGDDRTVRIWNIYNFQQVAQLDDQQAVGSPLCFTRDGKYLLTVNMSDYLQVNALTPPQAAGAETTPTRSGKRAKKRRHR
jgi:WD40 repeat protein